MIALISSVAVGIVSFAVINYAVVKAKTRNASHKALNDVGKPLSEWLAVYNAENDHLKPVLACALIGAACNLGVYEELFSIQEGYDFMEYARKQDYVPPLRLMVELYEDYPNAGVTDQTPAHELVALAIARFLNTARNVSHTQAK